MIPLGRGDLRVDTLTSQCLQGDRWGSGVDRRVDGVRSRGCRSGQNFRFSIWKEWARVGVSPRVLRLPGLPFWPRARAGGAATFWQRWWFLGWAGLTGR